MSVLANVTNAVRSVLWSSKHPSVYNNFMFKSGGAYSMRNLSDADAIRLGYQSNAHVYAVIKKAAEGVAALPYKLINIKPNGEQEEITEGEVHNIVFQPNEGQSLRNLWEENAIYYFTTGEAYFYYPKEAIGYPSDTIRSLPPELIAKEMTDRSILADVKMYYLNDLSGRKPLLPEEILHIRMADISVAGRSQQDAQSPLQAGQNKLNASNNNAIAQSEYFENRGIAGVISGGNADGSIMLNANDKAALEAANVGTMGGAHRMNRIITVGAPIQFTGLSAPASDMQMIESNTQLLRDLCNLYFMPSELFNDPENKTHANRKEAIKTLYNDVLIPHGERFCDGYKRTILKEWSKRDGKNYQIIIDKDAIDALKADPMELRKETREDVKAGLISENEWRIENGYAAIDDPTFDTPKRNNGSININTQQ